MRATVLAVALCCAATTASAEDWTGAYIGAVGTYGWGSIPQERFLTINVAGRMKGTMIGATAGYNFQIPNSSVVVSIEADASWGSLKRGMITAFGFALDGEHRANFLGSARARIGYAFENALLYAAAGAGWMRSRASTTFYVNNGLVLDLGSASRSDVGYVIGGGLEYAVSPHWSVKAEYLYFDFGPHDYMQNERVVRMNLNLVRMGLNYRF